VLSPDGVVTIATSTYPEMLDWPLTRKGRFDLQLELGPLDGECLAAMFVAFYGEGDRGKVDRFLRSGYYRPVVGAVAQDLFRHHDPDTALRLLRDMGEVSEAGQMSNAGKGPPPAQIPFVQ
jgi:hypothetical protein